MAPSNDEREEPDLLITTSKHGRQRIYHPLGGKKIRRSRGDSDSLPPPITTEASSSHSHPRVQEVRPTASSSQPTSTVASKTTAKIIHPSPAEREVTLKPGGTAQYNRVPSLSMPRAAVNERLNLLSQQREIDPSASLPSTPRRHQPTVESANSSSDSLSSTPKVAPGLSNLPRVNRSHPGTSAPGTPATASGISVPDLVHGHNRSKSSTPDRTRSDVEALELHRQEEEHQAAIERYRLEASLQRQRVAEARQVAETEARIRAEARQAAEAEARNEAESRERRRALEANRVRAQEDDERRMRAEVQERHRRRAESRDRSRRTELEERQRRAELQEQRRRTEALARQRAESSERHRRAALRDHHRRAAAANLEGIEDTAHQHRLASEMAEMERERRDAVARRRQSQDASNYSFAALSSRRQSFTTDTNVHRSGSSRGLPPRPHTLTTAQPAIAVSNIRQQPRIHHHPSTPATSSGTVIPRRHTSLLQRGVSVLNREQSHSSPVPFETLRRVRRDSVDHHHDISRIPRACHTETDSFFSLSSEEDDSDVDYESHCDEFEREYDSCTDDPSNNIRVRIRRRTLFR